MALTPITQIEFERFRTLEILEALVEAKSQLMAVNQAVKRIPNANILINTLGIQEAKTSSEIENVFTTVRDLFTPARRADKVDAAKKEVSRYRVALDEGYQRYRANELLTTSALVAIANTLNGNQEGVRRTSGTVIANSLGQVVYEPPQGYETLMDLLSDLERFLNDASIAPKLDPIIKMALAHWFFESVHPFGDGNGRSGRILNVFYLVKSGLLDAPVLYLSRQILRSKSDYYRHLRAANEEDDLEGMVLYMLSVVEASAIHTREMIDRIAAALKDYKHRIRKEHAFYSQDLINMLFVHTYVTHESLMKEISVSRSTALKYLGLLTDGGFLVKLTHQRKNYYVNQALLSLLEEDEKLGG